MECVAWDLEWSMLGVTGSWVVGCDWGRSKRGAVGSRLEIEVGAVSGCDQSDERGSPNRDGAWRDMGEVIAHVADDGRGRVMAHLLGDRDETGCHCRVHEDETCHHVWVETDSFTGHEGGILVPGRGEDGSHRVVVRLDGGKVGKSSRVHVGMKGVDKMI